MSGKRTIAGDLVADTVAAFPEASSLALARKLRAASPEVFSSVENARMTVRYVRGAAGQRSRHRSTAPRSSEDVAQCKQWGALLPDPTPREWAEVPLPADVFRWLILADLHIPFYDKQATEAAIRHGANEKCDGVILLGDALDFYTLSTWCKDPRQRRFREEVEMLWRFVDVLHSAIAPKRMLWKLGNHEQRYERYLMQRAPELFDAESFSFEAAVRANGSMVQIVPPMSPIRHGKLSILHGHEWPSGISSPVNPARGAFLRAISCTLTGHQHRSSEHTETTMDEKTLTCWSLGCLCDLRPMYRPVANRWNHGFAVLKTGGKAWSVDNKRIVDGEVM